MLRFTSYLVSLVHRLEVFSEDFLKIPMWNINRKTHLKKQDIEKWMGTIALFRADCCNWPIRVKYSSQSRSY